MASEDQTSEDGDYQNIEEVPVHEMVYYRVCYSHMKNAKEVNSSKVEEVNTKRCAGRNGNNIGRIKRVVSCKRKTHHLSVGRRKQPVATKSCDWASGNNEMSCARGVKEPCNASWDFVSQSTKMEDVDSKYTDFFMELSKDHNTIIQVLFGRNLKLCVAWTLWQRNVGELLTYLFRIQDASVFVDLLPVITQSIRDETPSLSIGCCVDLLPLVETVLCNPYEDYLVVGLRWVQSVLKRWWPELSANESDATDLQSDRNFHVIKQQLLELWNMETPLSLVPGTTGQIVKDIASNLSKLD